MKKKERAQDSADNRLVFLDKFFKELDNQSVFSKKLYTLGLHFLKKMS